MSHYHYWFEAHNRKNPDGTLVDPVTISVILTEPDPLTAQVKASALTDREFLQAERIEEHDPIAEAPWMPKATQDLEFHLNGV